MQKSSSSRSSKAKVSFKETTDTIPAAKKHADPFKDERVREDGKKRSASSPERSGSAEKRSNTSGSSGTRKVLPAKGVKK
ncbi:predicted protein [Sclerotinia sclerotiorum 1980 UF-70]|uniref:Uncharacterized protein n=2 Tax=Sclerotinia sclerotiorum (strain ATCC 18683 / 1980 / Ss-1) TaxID=665079 RepID=A7F373_SCLS1|nr:predicted protein [Sclerotinia sclerotiorum 1980 UF-70]APA14430.1 hypothetical protein sscle_12g092000 [Sclerotinia sclerotiorum 1980 UF-70]EDN97194.1 predicted protein [Sclerotinia sclerotiorum 1980 UF-70]